MIGEPMKELSHKLVRLVKSAEASLLLVPEVESSKPVLSGGWSRKQVLGHLIDSASSNHQRFVRAALQSSLDFPSYDQDGSVRVQAVEEADWPLLVALWADYNRQMVQSFTSPVLADPSGCLPVRPMSSSARKGIPVPSMPRYKV
jgi:hypothetical protein